MYTFVKRTKKHYQAHFKITYVKKETYFINKKKCFLILFQIL